MKVATTIQISRDEDEEIEGLKRELGLPSKRAVVLEGIHVLKETIREKNRGLRLQSLSLRLREQSQKINSEWAPLSSALRMKDGD